MKKALRSCRKCWYWRAKIGKQQMANLPAHRVTPSQSLTACGTDLMGPLYVKIGRSSVKRYVWIFNCLATRAEHFVIVQTLEASAFIKALRRFCHRRIALVRHIYGDNAGNFTSANCELNEGIKVWKTKAFQDAMLRDQVLGIWSGVGITSKWLHRSIFPSCA